QTIQPWVMRQICVPNQLTTASSPPPRFPREPVLRISPRPPAPELRLSPVSPTHQKPAHNHAPELPSARAHQAFLKVVPAARAAAPPHDSEFPKPDADAVLPPALPPPAASESPTPQPPTA